MDPTQSDQTQTQTQPQSNDQLSKGVQERINELTAKLYEERGAREQAQQIAQELIAQNASRVNQPPPVQQQPQMQLPEGMDPTHVAFFANMYKAQSEATVQALRAELAPVLGGVKQTQEQMLFQQAAAGYTPEVVNEAKRLQAVWSKNNYSGWTPEDALIYAEGIAAKKARAQQRMQRPNGDGNDTTVTAGGSMPNPVQQTSRPHTKSEEEIRRMTPAEAVAYWGARVGDTEIL